MNPGDLISGKYRLLRQLGRGGMGSVWAARNELTDRDFAVKFLLPELAKNHEALHRFFLEARACGQIKHPAVVAVYDMGQAEDGTPYLVMELMEGEGLDQRLARSGVFRPGEAAASLAFICRGLEEAHVRGLVHRDLKPANIFFALDDRGDVVPRVLDFGVSKATAEADPKFVRTNTGAVLGSPAYMSPEQARGDEDIDGRSDVWSLGIILYECLTGRHPFEGNNYNQLMVNIITQPHKPVHVINPAVPIELSELADRTLAKDRKERVSTALELAEALEAIATRITGTPYPGMPVRPKGLPLAPSPTPTETWVDVPRPRDATPMVWLSALVIAAALLSIGGLAIARSRPPVTDVASRGVMILRDAKTRLGHALETATPTDEAPAPIPIPLTSSASASASAQVITLPRDEPAGSATSKSSAAPRPSSKSYRPSKTPVHQGVTKPGF